MLTLDPAQGEALIRSRFFAHVAAFVGRHGRVESLRAAALDKPLCNTLWTPHWPFLARQDEAQAALFMCFLLACAVLRIDVGRAETAVRQSVDPERSMRLFLCERGLFLAADLDPAAWRLCPVR